MTKTHTLLRGAEIYTPEPIGRRDILICGEQVIAIEENLGRFAALEDVETVSLEGKTLVPGFIDNHVHILGGGGGGGPSTRGPEIFLSDLAICGTTTVVGLLGVDGLTRNLSSLLAKVRSLKAEGLTAYMWVGAYQYPQPTLCGGAQWDMLLIPEVIGTGEIAVADERGTHPSALEIARLAGETNLGAQMSGKKGSVCIHMGNGSEGFGPLLEASEHKDVHISRFLPTHLNRSSELLQRSIEFARKGGYMDFTTAFTVDGGIPNALAASWCSVEARAAGIPLEQICFSTDGNGVHSFFDAERNFSRTRIWPVSSLWDEARRLITEHGWPIEDALRPVTANPAQALGLQKGAIAAGRDADLVALDGSFNVDTVYARGKPLVQSGKPIVRGRFEREK